MKNVKMDFFIPKLKELYPDLDEKVLKKIVNRGCHGIMNSLKEEKDVMIESSRKKVKMVIYQYRYYSDQKKINEARRNKQVQ